MKTGLFMIVALLLMSGLEARRRKKTNKEVSEWNHGCDFPNHNIDYMKLPKKTASRMTCEKTCTNNKRCNYYVYKDDQEMCYLKQGNAIVAKPRAATICGRIISRISTRPFKQHIDGLYELADNCSWDDESSFIEDLREIKSLTTAACGNACHSDTKCTQFDFLNTTCTLKMSTNFVETETEKDASCGRIPSRLPIGGDRDSG